MHDLDFLLDFENPDFEPEKCHQSSFVKNLEFLISHLKYVTKAPKVNKVCCESYVVVDAFAAFAKQHDYFVVTDSLSSSHANHVNHHNATPSR